MKGSNRADILSVVKYSLFLVTQKVKYSKLNVIGDFKLRKMYFFYTANNSVVEFTNIGYSLTVETQICKWSLEGLDIFM